MLFVLIGSDRSKASNKYQSAISKREFLLCFIYYLLDTGYIRLYWQKSVHWFTVYISPVKLLYTKLFLMEVYTCIKICP